MIRITEVDQVSHAFALLRQFEEYRLRKSWGLMLIVVGISYVISSILVFLQHSIQEDMDPFGYMRTIRVILELQQFLIVFIYLPILISLLLAVYTFVSVKKANFKGADVVLQKYTFFGAALFSMSVLPLHSLLFLFIDPILSLVIGIGGCVIAYYFMHRIFNL